jgi:hypothetical protein
MNSQALIQQLTQLLNEGHAHVTFEEAVAELPSELRNVKPQRCRIVSGNW